MNTNNSRDVRIAFAALSLIYSKTIFWYIDDREGANLLVVIVMTLILYTLSISMWRLVHSFSLTKEKSPAEKITLTFIFQTIVTLLLGVILR
jgi:hypothetical protein